MHGQRGRSGRTDLPAGKKWYHVDTMSSMAMTLRLDDALDQQIQDLADAKGLSKQQLLVLAAREYVDRENRMSRTLNNADRVVRENAGLLDRLGQ